MADIDYANVELIPTLSKGLDALCRDKPDDPKTWLANWLLANKPPARLAQEGTTLAKASDHDKEAAVLAQLEELRRLSVSVFKNTDEWYDALFRNDDLCKSSDAAVKARAESRDKELDRQIRVLTLLETEERMGGEIVDVTLEEPRWAALCEAVGANVRPSPAASVGEWLDEHLELLCVQQEALSEAKDARREDSFVRYNLNELEGALGDWRVLLERSPEQEHTSALPVCWHNKEDIWRVLDLFARELRDASQHPVFYGRATKLTERTDHLRALLDEWHEASKEYLDLAGQDSMAAGAASASFGLATAAFAEAVTLLEERSFSLSAFGTEELSESGTLRSALHTVSATCRGEQGWVVRNHERLATLR